MTLSQGRVSIRSVSAVARSSFQFLFSENSSAHANSNDPPTQGTYLFTKVVRVVEDVERNGLFGFFGANSVYSKLGNAQIGGSSIASLFPRREQVSGNHSSYESND